MKLKTLFSDKEYRKAWLIFIGSHFPCWFSRYVYIGAVLIACLICLLGYKEKANLLLSVAIIAFVGLIICLDYKGKVLLVSYITREISVKPKRFKETDDVVNQVEIELPIVLEWARKRNKKLKFTTYESMFSEIAKRFEVPRSEFNAAKALKGAEDRGPAKQEVDKDNSRTIILHPRKINDRICIKCKKGPKQVSHEKAIQLKSLFPPKAKLVGSTRAVQHYVFEIEWRKESRQEG